ncbi:hypothetical protein COBT_003858, partial [Conglomerata obtusa]
MKKSNSTKELFEAIEILENEEQAEFETEDIDKKNFEETEKQMENKNNAYANKKDSKYNDNTIDDIMHKLDNLTLTIQNNKNPNKRTNNEHLNLICKICRRTGHASHNCYYNNVNQKNFESKYNNKNMHNNFTKSNYENKKSDLDKNYNTNKFSRNENNIEKIMNHFKNDMPQKLYELEKLIENKTESLQKTFDSLPGNYNTLETLRKNEHFTTELFKQLFTRKETNIIDGNEKEKNFTILKGTVFINELPIECVIDTGANSTIISEDLAIELNLAINIKNIIELKMANGNITTSVGMIEELPIMINKHIYDCNAI